MTTTCKQQAARREIPPPTVGFLKWCPPLLQCVVEGRAKSQTYRITLAVEQDTFRMHVSITQLQILAKLGGQPLQAPCAINSKSQLSPKAV